MKTDTAARGPRHKPHHKRAPSQTHGAGLPPNTAHVDTMTKASKAEREDALERLRSFLAPGDTVTCVLRSVSRSGMSRRIDFYKFAPAADGKVDKFYLSGLVGTALGWNVNNTGIRVDGCGMDMGFHVVHELGYALFGRCERPEGERGNWPLRHEWLG